jgi:hypothetical protein
MDLAQRSTVRELVATLNQTEDVVRRTFAEIHEAETQCNALFVLGGSKTMRIDPSYGGHSGADWQDPDRVIERLRRTAWGCIVERLELGRVLSSASWNELQQEIEKGPIQPVNEQTVNEFVQRFTGNLRGLFEAKVTEVFDWLRPRHARNEQPYKTNVKNALEALGPKIIISGVVEEGYGRTRYRVRHWQSQHLAALESVFRTLDGQGYGTNTYYGELHDAINNSDGTSETTYFRFRVFQNGNMHLSFRRLDLLAKLNSIAGGKNLREGV